MNTDNITIAVNDLKSAITNKFGDDTSLILFGSAARGECTGESDIDVLILTPGIVDTRLEEEIISIAYDIELKYNVIFGIIIYSKEFWNSDLAGVMPIYKSIASDGIPL